MNFKLRCPNPRCNVRADGYVYNRLMGIVKKGRLLAVCSSCMTDDTFTDNELVFETQCPSCHKMVYLTYKS